MDRERRGGTLVLNVSLMVLFWIFFLSIDEPFASIWVAILYTVHTTWVWGVFFYELFYAEWLIERLSLFRIGFLYASTTTQYAFWYAFAMAENPGAFIGIPPPTTRIAELGRGYFVAVELTASLGTGALIPAGPGVLTAVALNAFQGTAFWVVAAPMIWGLFWFRHTRNLTQI